MYVLYKEFWWSKDNVIFKILVFYSLIWYQNRNIIKNGVKILLLWAFETKLPILFSKPWTIYMSTVTL